MKFDERWDRLSPSDWDAFARAWIAELRGETAESETSVGVTVVGMNYWARPKRQWQFILAAMANASDEELVHIAAGPVEDLLSKYGAHYIDEVERRAETDPKFARMLSGVWRLTMSDDVWARVEALQAKYGGSPEPDTEG